MNTRSFPKIIQQWIISSLPTLNIFTIIILDTFIIFKFLIIKNINYPLCMGLIFLGTIFSYIFTRLLEHKAIIIKLVAIALVVAVLFVYLKFIIENQSDLYAGIQKINEYVYYSQPVDFSLIVNMVYILLPLILFLALLADYYDFGSYFIIFINFIIIYISYYTREYTIQLALLSSLLLIYIGSSSFNKNYKKAIKNKLLVTISRGRNLSYLIFISLITILMSVSFISVTGTRNLSEIKALMDQGIINKLDFTQAFSISSAGFGKSEKLGGPISVNDNIVMRVDSDKPYYLRGSIKNFYDGQKWSADYGPYYFVDGPNDRFLNKNILDILFSAKENQNFIQPRTISIYNEDMKETALFTPYNTLRVTSGNKKIVTNYDNMYLISDKSFNFYNVDFYDSSTGSENFENYKLNNLKFDYNPLKNPEDSDDYVKNVQQAYSSYLGVEPVITDRTKQLVRDITKNSYTIEDKINDIKNYLYNNFKYDTNVSEVPENQDFIDYFLFTEKKGYCTYFATAATMLCRMEGVPARYVEGYKMEDNKDSSGLYVVKNRDAHAWCEILVSSKNNLWAILDCTPASLGASSAKDENIKVNNNVLKMIKSNDKTQLNKAVINGQYSPIMFELNVYSRLFKIALYIGIVIVVLIIMLLITIVGKSFWHYYYKKHQIFTHSKIDKFYNYLKDRCYASGIISSINIDDQQFIDSIDNEEIQKIIKNIVFIYREETYGEKVVKSNINRREDLRRVERYIKKHQNLFGYYKAKFELCYINIRHRLRIKV